MAPALVGSESAGSDPVADLAEFWASEYLGWYVRQGGSKVKLVTSIDREKTASLLSRFHDLALSQGYASYMVDARNIGRLKLAMVYRAFLEAVDLDSLIDSYCSRIVERMGYDPVETDPRRSFVDWAVEDKARDRNLVSREVNERLEMDLFRNPAVNRTFATAIMELCAVRLGSRNLPEEPERVNMKDALFAWIKGGEVLLRDLRRYHVYTRIDRYNARVMLRSLTQVARMAGKVGLILIIDGLDTLLDRRETGRPVYTRAARDEFYESLRQFIDEVEVFNHTMIVVGFTRDLVDDMSLGLRSYEALWLRIQNEVAGDRPNLFRDFVDLDSFSAALEQLPEEAAAGTSEPGGVSAGAGPGPARSRYAGVLGGSVPGPERDFAAASIIETLRSGVTSRSLARLFCYGREALLEKAERELSAIRDGGGSRGIVIRGEYGEGKTHLLNAIANEALKMNFAVSFVVLSKETPFNRLDKVYPKLVANTYIPGQGEPGIVALLRDLRPDDPVARDLLALAEEKLHPKVYHVLNDYLHVGDTYSQHLLEGDLSGAFVPVSFVRAVHRTVAGRSAKIPRFSVKTDVLDYFRLISAAVRRKGLSGWLVLFDEFELVGTLGAKARGDAYLNIETFLGLATPSVLDSTLSLFSVASRYWPDILLREKRPDTSEIPGRLVAQGRPAEAKHVERVLRFFLQEPVPLGMLTEAEVGKMLSALAETHGKAYSSEGDLDVPSVQEATKHARLRTRIRYALECLDLKFLYGHMPEVAAGELQEQTLIGGEKEEQERDRFKA